jgi:hypothetical protein
MFTIAAMPASEALRAFEENVPRVSITSKTTLDTVRIPRKRKTYSSNRSPTGRQTPGSDRKPLAMQPLR